MKYQIIKIKSIYIIYFTSQRKLQLKGFFMANLHLAGRHKKEDTFLDLIRAKR